ncbi:FUSC family protein [Mycolicibacterium sp. P9-64]|uniref:FUSC family protein n=1 Tax=Mycolicibacterium sp. P9-64 TaxID=2024612 RepID=UPI0032215561
MALVQRLSKQLRDAVQLRFGDASPEAADLAQLRRPRLPARVRSIIAAIRGQLVWSSPVLRHAVRLASATAIGVAVARFADVPHGYWIPLTVVMVLRPETAHTYTRCVGRVAGNVIGIVVASAVILLVHPTGYVAVALAVVFLGVAYAVSSVGYLALSAALAAAIVFLVDIAGTAGTAAVGDRLLATLIGGALAVLAHVAVPDDAIVRLRQRAGELLKTETDYAATVIKAFVHRLDDPAEALSAAWERAFRARAAFEAAAGASWSQDRPFRRWLRSYRTALNAVTAACAALEASLPGQPSATLSRDFTAAVDSYVEALCGDPATPGSPWRVDVARLAEAAQRVRAELSGNDDATTRVLVTEIGTITTQLGNISAEAERTSAPS